MRAALSSSLRLAFFVLTSCGLVGCVGGAADEDSAGASRRHLEPDELAKAVSATWIEASELSALATLKGPEASIFAEKVILDDLDQAHVRFAQLYKGVVVFEGQLITHIDLLRHEVTGVTDALVELNDASEDIDVVPTLSDLDATLVAIDALGLPIDVEGESDLLILANRGVKSPRLAYRIHLSDDEGPVDQMIFVDAHTGERLWGYDNLHTAKGKGKPGGGGGGTGTSALGLAKTLYVENVDISTQIRTDGTFDLTDLSRGVMSVNDMMNRQAGSGSLFVDADNTWGNNTNSDRATVGGEALFGAEMTWDYYLDTFGRNGIFDDGKGSLSRVHYGRNYNNAFWSGSCRCMTYGDGDGNVLSPLVALDVAGHEMTHGVTQATANLTYSGESGGLNESFSDIFGTMVEFYATANGAQKSPNYWIGEDIYTPSVPNDALRYMDTPRKDGRSIDHYSQYSSGMDVHYSSGLANQVFYLLAEGGKNPTSGQSVSGIGREKAAKIFYRALTLYMNSGTDFAGARQATLSAAAGLSLGASDLDAVATAWSACGVN